MPMFSPAHRSADGIAYAYFWVRILSESDLSSAITIGNHTDQTDSTMWIEGLVPGRAQFATLRAGIGTATPPIVGISHYAFPSSYDASRHGVTIHDLPPGTNLEQAKAWIQGEEGKRWAGRGFCFLAHSAVLVEG